jgi:hypothetical protein
MNKLPILIVFLVLALVIGACGINVNLDVAKGSGNVVTETRDVSGFDKMILSGIGDVTLIQADQESLKIEAEDNVITHITTEVQNGTLHISYDRKTIVPTKPVKFTLTMKDIHSIESEGVSNVETEQINTDALTVSISGTGNIHIRNLKADQLTANISGAGNFTADGQVTGQSITMSGAGNFDGEDMQSSTTKVIISGLGRVVVWVTDTLDVTISGTGGVDYYGSPQINQQISGLGRLKQLGNK